QVNLDEGKLILSRATNDQQAAFTQLSTLMGLRQPETYRLAEEPVSSGLSTNVADLVEVALRSRPDVLRLRNEREAAVKFARAEKALNYPTISAVGTAGVVPVRDSALPPNYAAAGVGLSLPIFAGGLYSARQKEAALRAQASDQALRDEENNVV